MAQSFAARSALVSYYASTAISMHFLFVVAAVLPWTVCHLGRRECNNVPTPLAMRYLS